MKILFISSRFYPDIGGVESVVWNLARRLSENDSVLVVKSDQRRGLELLAAAEDSSPESKLGFPVVSLWLNLPGRCLGWLAFPPRFVRGLLSLDRTIRRFKPDLINYHFPDASSVYVYLTAWRRKVPLVTNIHGNDLQVFANHGWYRFFLRRIFRLSRKVIVHSEYIRRELCRFAPAIGGRVELIPNAIDPGEFPPLEGVKGQAKIVFYGRLAEKKNVELLIRAYSRLPHALREEYRLEIIGDGPLRGKLTELADRLNLAERVSFTGSIPHNQEFLTKVSQAAVVVFPSKREPFGIVALEAAYLKVPIIASRTGGFAEILRDGETACLFASEDLDDLVRVLRKVLERQVDTAKLIANAYRMVQNYTWSAILPRYQEVFAAAR